MKPVGGLKCSARCRVDQVAPGPLLSVHPALVHPPVLAATEGAEIAEATVVVTVEEGIEEVVGIEDAVAGINQHLAHAIAHAVVLDPLAVRRSPAVLTFAVSTGRSRVATDGRCCS